MRLFIAVNFDQTIIHYLTGIQNQLRGFSAHGNFTRKENLHLTVVFIGETLPARVRDITAIIDSIDARSFAITINKAGSFKRNNGDIVWVGIENIEQLVYIQRQLADALIQKGFDIDNRPYKPHLTLARSVRFNKGFSFHQVHAPPIEINVNRISLMCSEQINGVLTYTEIFGRSF